MALPIAPPIAQMIAVTPDSASAVMIARAIADATSSTTAYPIDGYSAGVHARPSG
jgi:hypothetical protein